MAKFIKFPSIGQFRDAIKQVKSACAYHNVPLPTVDFRGTVKLHGTNAAVMIAHDGTWHCQSRERIITPQDDNAGFAAWVYGNKDYWDRVAATLNTAILSDEETVQVYGEWCGGNIQKNVGLSYLPKIFVIFGIRFGNDAESTAWQDINKWKHLFFGHYETPKPSNLHFADDFPTYNVTIDFNSPTLVQNQLVEITEAVEKDCPVARYFLPDSTDELIGEGVVWEVDRNGDFELPDVLDNTFSGIRFKVKGSRHSASKVKTIAPVDVEKVKSIDAFVEYACTQNRLEQGLTKLTEMGLDHSTKSTGDYLRWIMQDILKEELETMTASGIEPKDVNGQIARKARDFFMNNLA